MKENTLFLDTMQVLLEAIAIDKGLNKNRCRTLNARFIPMFCDNKDIQQRLAELIHKATDGARTLTVCRLKSA